MNIPIVFSRRFDRDLGEVLRYLRKEASDAAANKIRDRVFESIETLYETRNATLPNTGLLTWETIGSFNSEKHRTKFFTGLPKPKFGLSECSIPKETLSEFFVGSNFEKSVLWCNMPLA